MARARNIKPSIFKNEILGTIDPLYTILFESLWCQADREGRLEDRPLRIKAETFPYRENLDINVYLTELDKLGFIRRYKVAGVGYIQVTNFLKHQNPHKTEKASVIPPISEADQELTSVPVNNSLNNETETDKPGTRPADSLLLIPDSGFLIPDPLVLIPETAPGSENTDPAPAKKNGKRSEPITHAAWAAYAFAYKARYRVDPVRNEKVNGILANLVKRLGESEAPAVASFYVRHNRALYVSSKHAVDLLLRDCEGLRTEWATGRTVTESQARQGDRKQNNLDVAQDLIAEERAKNGH